MWQIQAEINANKIREIIRGVMIEKERTYFRIEEKIFPWYFTRK
jgi:hypothetical protein